MILSDISITRPVFASVLALLLVVFGLVAFVQLPLREYPDIDSPVVSIVTRYPGAAASVVEKKITQIIEDRVAGIQGIRSIAAANTDGLSRITIEFDIDRDIDAAANDIRDRVAGVLKELPTEADPPEVQKEDGDDNVILWLTLVGEGMTIPELTDYVNRYVVDRFSALDGVARIRIAGEQVYAIRVWLKRSEMAARNLTVGDIENALRSENVELPAGNIESMDRQFTVRVQRSFQTPEAFRQLVVGQGADGYLVRLGDVARVALEAFDDRSMFRSNGVPMIALGVIKQSTANVITVAEAATAEMERINATLPPHMRLINSYDSSVFVKGAISEVYQTIAIAIALVFLVIFLFLGNLRATLVPAITVPVSIIATCTVILALGFTINILTLLALVLAIGLVVDDAIVVLENIHRRMEKLGESVLVATYRGTRQVGFAVMATMLVLVAVFVPITFLQGDVGRLFSEFAMTIAAAVLFSGLLALTVAPAIASKVLTPHTDKRGLTGFIDREFDRIQSGYRTSLQWLLRHPGSVALLFIAMVAGSLWLAKQIPGEYAPQEDRGSLFLLVNGPEGASFSYMREYMEEIEQRLNPLVTQNEIERVLTISPRGITRNQFNTGILVINLHPWGERRPVWAIMKEIRVLVSDLPGVRVFPIVRPGLGGSFGKPVQFVIGGGTYDELAQWRDILLDRIAEDNPGLLGLDSDYKETKPQIDVAIDYDRAADLGITVSEIGRTLETMLGSRRVTTYIDAGEEYDVVLEGERSAQRTPASLENIYVRSQRSGQLIPLSNVVHITESAAASQLNRYNRVRAVTLEANLDEKLMLGDALAYLDELARKHLPEAAIIDYKGQSKDFIESSGSIVFALVLGVVVVFLVLAAQFESYVHPLIVMLAVPPAMAGALLGLYLTGQSLNIYTQIGLIMLVGLAAKNGILIVEFANQLREQGLAFEEALTEAATQRLRPILMTGITTVAGSVPLLMASGAGAETRFAIGMVIFFGVLLTTAVTSIFIPVAYRVMARHTGSPGDVKRRLKKEIAWEPKLKDLGEPQMDTDGHK